MNKYLLLRDNKQTGPYTAEELATKGLKAYDLIWQEGKSAAWRYPSEINELKAFAPAVEEQPYDRFYKKPGDNGERPVNGTAATTQESIPVRQIVSATITTSPSGKISVTLPGNNRANFVPSTKPASTPVAAQANESEPIGEAKDIPLNDPNETIKEEMLIRSYPDRSTEHSMAFAESADRSYETLSDQLASRKIPGSFKGSIIPWVGGTLLLLSGILIGLFYNYNRQRVELKQLNALVHEIQQKNTNTTPSNKPKPASNQSLYNQAALIPDNTVVDSSHIVTPVVEAEKESLAVKKSKPVHTTVLVKDTASRAPMDSQEVPKTTTAIVDNAVSKTEISKDLARKSLFQLVHVTNNEYKTGLLGGITGLQLILSNKSVYPLDKVEVEVQYLSPENRVVRTQTVFFENVSAGESLTMDVPKSTRGVSVNYLIKKINSRELGMAQSGL
jgi:hypothetical protein